MDGHENLITEYRQRRNVRRESLTEAAVGHRPTVTILNLDRRGRIYSRCSRKAVCRVAGLRSSFDARHVDPAPTTRRGSPAKPSIFISRTLIPGSGGRCSAIRRAISLLENVTLPETGACSQDDSEIDTDGWYITWPEGTARYEAYLEVAGGEVCHDNIVLHGKRVKKGFPVLETTTDASAASAGLPAHISSRRTEVIELSEEALDPNLFTPPHDFRRVNALPGEPSMSWTQRLEFEWRQIGQSIESWFD